MVGSHISERLRETNILLITRAARNVDEEIDSTLSFGDCLANPGR